jgi:hypothetical protein
MKTIHWLLPEEQDEWDAFVTRHPRGLVYQLSSWQRALESAFGHIRGRFIVLRDGSGQIQAGLPIYTVSSWLLGNRTVSVPFATMCDPLISTKEEFNLLWPAIEEASTANRSRSIEIRTRHTSSDCIPALLTASGRYKHHYLPLGKPTDELFRSFDKSNICRGVEKAKREGVVVEEREDEQDLRVFHAFLVATRRKHLLPPMPFAFFQAMYRSLRPNHITLYLAIHAGEPVGVMLVLKFRDLWTAEYLTTDDKAIRGTSSLLYWDAIQRAKSSGAASFSFGRTSLDNPGLLNFKRRWAPIEEELTDFTSHQDSTSAQGHESSKAGVLALYSTPLRLFMRYSPAAVQKLIGDFCYHHLG